LKARPISCVEKNENTWLKVKISLREPEMKNSLPEPEIAYLDGSKRKFSDSLESSSAHSQDESSKEQHLNESNSFSETHNCYGRNRGRTSVILHLQLEANLSTIPRVMTVETARRAKSWPGSKQRREATIFRTNVKINYF